MKKILTFIFILSATIAYSQINFVQGYMKTDSVVIIFSDVNYTLHLNDSLIYLPTGTVKIDSFRVVNVPDEPLKSTGLQFFLSDDSVAQYYRFQPYGDVFSVIWVNGRLTLWTQKQKSFNINIK